MLDAATSFTILTRRRDFTFVCPTEILAFNAALPAFKALNASVLGVSTDSKFTHFQWATTPRSLGGLGPEADGRGAPLAVPLIADKNHKISSDYGCLLEEEGFPLRATYLIAPKGVLRQMTVNDTPVGRSVEEMIRLVKAFQFTVRASSWRSFHRSLIHGIFLCFLSTGRARRGLPRRLV